MVILQRASYALSKLYLNASSNIAVKIWSGWVMEFATDFWNLVFCTCINDAAVGFHSLWFPEDQESSLQPCLNTRMSQQWRPTLCIPCSTAFRRFLPQHQPLRKDTQQHPGPSAGRSPCTSFLVVDEVRPPSIIFLSSRSKSPLSSLRQMFRIWRMKHVWLEISSNSWLHYGVFVVADVLLWRERKLAVSLLAGSTLLWYLLEHLQYSLVSLVSNALLLFIGALFVWTNVASVLNRYWILIVSDDVGTHLYSYMFLATHASCFLEDNFLIRLGHMCPCVELSQPECWSIGRVCICILWKIRVLCGWEVILNILFCCHTGLVLLCQSCISQRISYSAQLAGFVYSSITIWMLSRILLLARISNYLSRYSSLSVGNVSQSGFKNFVFEMLSHLRLNWGMWQVVGALWLVATAGSWFHFLTLMWIGTSHCCLLVYFWQ